MQALTQEPEAPPTIKNAGRLNMDGDVGGLGVESAMMMAALLVLVAGGMLQAVMTSQSRALRGLALSAGYGVAAAVLVAITVGREAVAILVAMGIGMWLVLAVMAFAVGSIVKPPARR